MTAVTLTIDAMCAGLGHWQVTASDGATTRLLCVDWGDLQTPLDGDDLERLALLILRAKCAGVPINDLGELLLNGVAL